MRKEIQELKKNENEKTKEIENKYQNLEHDFKEITVLVSKTQNYNEL